MKKFLLGAVCALAVSSTSFAQMFGNDKGNGGDAVMINNEMVMRDFVARSTLTQIPDSVAFVKSIPGLKNLILEISQVQPVLATQIVLSLVDARFYTTDLPLDILPKESTAVNGVAAEVQLAVRWNDEIILAPEFKNFKQKDYLLVHEALHGVLRDTGAMHHQRVRAIVKYLKDNRGHYKANELNALLKETSYREYDLGLPQYIFDASLPVPLRCYVLSKAFYLFSIETGSTIPRYFEIDCGDKDPIFAEFVERYLAKQMDLRKWVSSYDGKIHINLYVYPDVDTTEVLSLPKLGLFESSFSQKDHCDFNDHVIESLTERANDVLPLKKFLNDLSVFLKRTDISENSKAVVLHSLFADETPKTSLALKAKEIQAVEQKVAVNKAIAFKNRKACDAKYGNSYKHK